MFFIHSFKADQDGRQIAHNLLGGRDNLAKIACEIPNGMVMYPFDYRPKRIYGKMTTGKPTVNEYRATWVRRWADWLLKEGVGLADICVRMNNERLPPPRASKEYKKPAATWSPKTVRDILRSRQLIGEFWWKGERYLKEDGLRVLSDEEFANVQARLDQNRDRRAYNACKYDYPPLRKMVYHQCGAMMYAKPSSRKPCYYCPKCPRSYVNAEKLWDRIQTHVKEELLKEERVIPALRKQFNEGGTIAKLEKDIESIEAGIEKSENAKDAAFRMGMTLKNYPPERVQEEINKAEEQIRRLKDDKADLEKRIAALKEQTLNEEGIRRLCRFVGNNLQNLSKEQWQMLLQMLKFKVVIENREQASATVALPPLRKGEFQFSRS